MTTAALRDKWSRPAHGVSSRTGGFGPAIALGLVVVAPIGLAITLDRTTYDEWGAFIWAPVLMVLALPVCRWLSTRTGEPHLYRFFVGAAFLKIVVGGVTRYYVLTEVYGGLGDGIRYDNAAAVLSPAFRRGNFTDLGEITGTRFIEVLTGLVQALIGETLLGTFLVFSFFGFLGLCFFYAAFRRAIPDGNAVLCRRLLFLMPTMWFWPSSAGKEAFLLLCIGAVVYGAALAFDGRLGGVLLAAAGMWGTITVRPHLALALGAGLIAALPPGRSKQGRIEIAAGRRFLGLMLPLAILIALPAIISTTEEFFDIEDLNVGSAQEFQDEVTRRTDQGGSDFAPPTPDDPVGVGLSVATVIARPFPWEARNLQSAVSAIETLALVGVTLVVVSRRGWALLTVLRQRLPRMAVVYLLSFAIGFSAVANFGILVRQRSLALPMLFVWLAAPPVRPTRS